MSQDEAKTTEEARELSELLVDRRAIERVRRTLNVLTESAFFYREDDPDLFLFLRRNAGAFRQFFERYFGWKLHADRRMARLLKEKLHNAALAPSQRALFDLRRRDECLLFSLLLEYFEKEGARQGVSPDDEANLRFVLADFVAFALGRFREELGGECPPEAKIFESVKPLFQQLEKHRFVREVERRPAEEGEALPAGFTHHLLYEFLPGIRCYDPSRAARELVFRAVRNAPAWDETSDPEGPPSPEEPPPEAAP